MTPSACIAPDGAWELLVQAGHDGELSAAEAAAVAAHVQACPHCAAWQAALGRLSAGLAEVPAAAAPPSLRRRMLAEGAGLRLRRHAGTLAGFGAGAALAAGLLLALLPAQPDPAEALVSGHVRAMLPGHLTDVASTDRHSVKPWFEGRLPFAPPVRDLAAAGGWM